MRYVYAGLDTVTLLRQRRCQVNFQWQRSVPTEDKLLRMVLQTLRARFSYDIAIWQPGTM